MKESISKYIFIRVLSRLPCRLAWMILALCLASSFVMGQEQPGGGAPKGPEPAGLTLEELIRKSGVLEKVEPPVADRFQKEFEVAVERLKTESKNSVFEEDESMRELARYVYRQEGPEDPPDLALIVSKLHRAKVEEREKLIAHLLAYSPSTAFRSLLGLERENLDDAADLSWFVEFGGILDESRAKSLPALIIHDPSIQIPCNSF